MGAADSGSVGVLTDAVSPTGGSSRATAAPVVGEFSWRAPETPGTYTVFVSLGGRFTDSAEVVVTEPAE